MPLEGKDQSSCLSVPYLGGLIGASRQHAFAVRREGRGADTVFMAPECQDQSAGECVPDLARLVEAARDDALAVPREYGGDDPPRVRVQLQDFAARLDVPHDRGAGLISGDDTPAVRRERGGRYTGGMSGERHVIEVALAFPVSPFKVAKPAGLCLLQQLLYPADLILLVTDGNEVHIRDIQQAVSIVGPLVREIGVPARKVCLSENVPFSDGFGRPRDIDLRETLVGQRDILAGFRGPGIGERLLVYGLLEGELEVQREGAVPPCVFIGARGVDPGQMRLIQTEERKDQDERKDRAAEYQRAYDAPSVGGSLPAQLGIRHAGPHPVRVEHQKVDAVPDPEASTYHPHNPRQAQVVYEGVGLVVAYLPAGVYPSVQIEQTCHVCPALQEPRTYEQEVVVLLTRPR